MFKVRYWPLNGYYFGDDEVLEFSINDTTRSSPAADGWADEATMLNRLQQLQPAGNRSMRLGRTILKAFGLMFLLYGALSFANELKMGQQSVQVTGKVFDVREVEKDGRIKFVPVVEFATLDGGIVHFQATATTSAPVKEASVVVLYNPAKPEEARLDSFSQRWLLPTIATPIGAAFLLAAAYWRHV